ncbi:MAG: DUF1801 domain-containing protein [Caulobacteraceae bacterium]
MTPSEQIDQHIAAIGDWRRETFAALRETILETDREIEETFKWMGSPVWERFGIIAVANAHKGKVKLTFDQGAHLPDPKTLFNAGLESNQRRAIDLFEGDRIDVEALQALVRAAIAFNQARKARAKKKG